MKYILSCDNITYRYEGALVLENISLALPEGGFVSLLGPSGVGKTTLFHILSGLAQPDRGRVLLNETDITFIPGRVSYMPQKDMLFDFYTALDNVILPLILRGISKREATYRANSFFPQFGLAGCQGKYPCQLSGGMRQRAALLRTCLMDNPVILLDEPFSALDAITRYQIHAWVIDIAKSMGLSILFVTHDVEEAITLSDTVYTLTGRPGRITAVIDIPHTRPRGKDFQSSAAFSSHKRQVLDAIGL